MDDGQDDGQVLACIECGDKPRVRGGWCGGCWAAMVRAFTDRTRPWN